MVLILEKERTMKVIEVKHWVESAEQAYRIKRTANAILQKKFHPDDPYWIDLRFDLDFDEMRYKLPHEPKVVTMALTLEAFVKTFGGMLAYPRCEGGDDDYPFCLEHPALNIIRAAIRKASSKRNER